MMSFSERTSMPMSRSDGGDLPSPASTAPPAVLSPLTMGESMETKAPESPTSGTFGIGKGRGMGIHPLMLSSSGSSASLLSSMPPSARSATQETMESLYHQVEEYRKLWETEHARARESARLEGLVEAKEAELQRLHKQALEQWELIQTAEAARRDADVRLVTMQSNIERTTKSLERKDSQILDGEQRLRGSEERCFQMQRERETADKRAADFAAEIQRMQRAAARETNSSGKQAQIVRELEEALAAQRAAAQEKAAAAERAEDAALRARVELQHTKERADAAEGLLKAALAERDAQTEELSSMQQRLAQQTQKARDAERARAGSEAQIKSLEKEREAFMARLGDADAKLAELKQKLSQKEEEVFKVASEARSQAAERAAGTRTVTEYETLVQELRSELAHMQERTESSFTAVHEAARLQGILAAREREVGRLQEQVKQNEEAESQLLRENAETQKRMAALEAENALTRSQLQQIESMRREFDQERFNRDSRDTEAQEKYQIEITDKQQEIIKMKTESSIAAAEIKRLKRDLQEREEQLRAREAEVAAGRATSGRDAEEITVTMTKLRTAEVSLREEQARQAGQQGEMISLKAALETARADVQRLRIAEEASSRAEHERKLELSNLKQQIARGELTGKAQSREAEHFKQELERQLEEHAKKTQEDRNRYESLIKMKDEIIDRLQRELHDQRSSNEILVKQRNDDVKELERSRGALEQLRITVGQVSNQLYDTQQDLDRIRTAESRQAALLSGKRKLRRAIALIAVQRCKRADFWSNLRQTAISHRETARVRMTADYSKLSQAVEQQLEDNKERQLTGLQAKIQAKKLRKQQIRDTPQSPSGGDRYKLCRKWRKAAWKLIDGNRKKKSIWKEVHKAALKKGTQRRTEIFANFQQTTAETDETLHSEKLAQADRVRAALVLKRKQRALAQHLGVRSHVEERAHLRRVSAMMHDTSSKITDTLKSARERTEEAQEAAAAVSFSIRRQSLTMGSRTQSTSSLDAGIPISQTR